MGDPLQQSVTTSTEAYTLYLQGKYFLAKRTQENVAKATENFLKAIELDNNSASIWAALSLAYASQANDGYLNPEEGFAKAREAAEKSIKLDRNLATGHYALASIQTSYDWDWAGAQEELTTARKLDPSNFAVINSEANLALAMGRFDEAIQLYKKALVLDPLRVGVRVNLGMALMYAKRVDEAVTTLNTAIEMNPQFPSSHYRLGLCYFLLGKVEQANVEIEKEKMEDWRMQGQALIYSGTARDNKADSLLTTFIKEYQDVSAFQIAEVYAYRKEKDKAFEWLEKAYAVRDGGLTSILGNPWMTALEKDPRYRQFLLKMKLIKG
jgi:tetratricopeptide (TPR) repeat protein